ncbi:hypothetical protein SISNIDRAFT_552659 [Sistotremastrum niveocremeum HHB9708]|uniref:Small ribosomal subunit protein mS38 n=1 Tax=Sistotremastrum niveocremeum HHB9708 TaxID=1314777 RepID=A0A164P6K8_9AGAM|nr:hypothetical protein SISNIDRAFT_552659 [Sistotremastrum niveocremeum HHB9708]
MSSTLTRIFQQTSNVSLLASRRSYSFFSSKPGRGGRYFNSTKPPKVPATATATSATTEKVVQVDGGNGSEQKAVAEEPSPPANPAYKAEEQSITAATSSPKPNTSPSSPLPNLQHNLLPLPPHRSLSSQSLNMHNFFSLHRPLLLVTQPMTSLFESPNSPLLPSTSSSSSSKDQQTLMDELERRDSQDLSPEADAEAARLLARALVVHRVGSTLDWENVLAHLGDKESMLNRRAVEDEIVRGRILMDSTKRKRRKKMTKHKLKKRRKLQRADRRRLGK